MQTCLTDKQDGELVITCIESYKISTIQQLKLEKQRVSAVMNKLINGVELAFEIDTYLTVFDAVVYDLTYLNLPILTG